MIIIIIEWGTQGVGDVKILSRGSPNTHDHFRPQAPAPMSNLVSTKIWIRTDLLCRYDRKEKHIVGKKRIFKKINRQNLLNAIHLALNTENNVKGY